MELVRLDPEVAREEEFTCGDPDLDEFYREDSIEGARELLSVSYAFAEGGELLAFFSVSNDSLRRDQASKPMLRRILSCIPQRKRYSSMPAVKIGRLGVSADSQRCGYGAQILDYLKVWFTTGNKTGCRFLLVDAYNRANVIAFYRENDFEFLTDRDEEEDTRIMYFDLKRFKEE